jgi:hypothetical protein
LRPHRCWAYHQPARRVPDRASAINQVFSTAIRPRPGVTPDRQTSKPACRARTATQPDNNGRRRHPAGGAIRSRNN